MIEIMHDTLVYTVEMLKSSFEHTVVVNSILLFYLRCRIQEHQ